MSKVQKLVNIALAEFLGTASMLFLVCTGCTSGIQGTISSLHLSLCSGLSVMAAIQMFGHISGAHINPVVSLAALMVDEISYLEIPVYIVSQVLGCLAGCGLQKMVTPLQHEIQYPGRGICVNAPYETLTDWEGSYTGASMNPVRSFGPAVWSNDFRSHWVYWVGPTIGSLIATITYKYSFLRVEVHTREYK
ncbi:unnamed protein product [Acanthoscelides obtectus]|uniref:Uncharacterized protein n=1 Tax=Acanthoscelides obtectus TaxID=200917 RepID=A0A9P0JK22_ACAOB|nr:unnamed protein product [Acanthoscelides obtectus]CAK1634612.1 Aquaporin-4 [Acanthoscelides obtectus]